MAGSEDAQRELSAILRESGLFDANGMVQASEQLSAGCTQALQKGKDGGKPTALLATATLTPDARTGAALDENTRFGMPDSTLNKCALADLLSGSATDPAFVTPSAAVVEGFKALQAALGAEGATPESQLAALNDFMLLGAKDEIPETCSVYHAVKLDEAGKRLLWIEAYPDGGANHGNTLPVHVMRWARFGKKLLTLDVKRFALA